ncbi:MAG: hypothetical protein ABEI52_01045, partial [Halobacteriaceae archaeon]
MTTLNFDFGGSGQAFGDGKTLNAIAVDPFRYSDRETDHAVYAVQNGGRISVSTDLGASWTTSYTSGSGANINDIFFDEKTATFWAVGDTATFLKLTEPDGDWKDVSSLLPSTSVNGGDLTRIVRNGTDGE